MDSAGVHESVQLATAMLPRWSPVKEGEGFTSLFKEVDVEVGRSFNHIFGKPFGFRDHIIR
jgi:hypothetical protein